MCVCAGLCPHHGQCGEDPSRRRGRTGKSRKPAALPMCRGGRAEKEPEQPESNHKGVCTDRDGSPEDPEPARGARHIPLPSTGVPQHLTMWVADGCLIASILLPLRGPLGSEIHIWKPKNHQWLLHPCLLI